MFEKIEGQIIYKSNSFAFVENEFDLKQIYLNKIINFELYKKYKFYIFVYRLIGNKNIEKEINFGFDNLNDAICFEDLINIDGVGIKSALKIIKNGYKEFMNLILQKDLYQITKQYSLSNNIATNILNYFTKKEMNNYTTQELKKINAAIDNLQKLGYTKQLSTKVVWKRKDQIISDQFVNVFNTLIEDIKSERINN